MIESFRLKHVYHAGLHGEKVEFHLGEDASDSGTWTTIMTGKNGVGKSRLMSQIASVFDALDSNKQRNKLNGRLEYSIGSTHCTVTVSNGHVTTTVNGSSVDPGRLPTPRSVVATTTTAFDKFPLPSQKPFGEDDKSAKSTYKYLGLKDSRGRISATAGVYRALDALFTAVALDEPRRNRVADVFTDLGYQPEIAVLYRWTKRGLDFLRLGPFGLTDESDIFSSQKTITDRSRDQLGRDSDEEPVGSDLSRAVQLVGPPNSRLELLLTADFAKHQFAHVDHLKAAQLLKRAKMIEMSRVSLVHMQSGKQLDIRDISSGELSLVTGVLGIASAIDDQSLVLIDEPEISLHPEWQSEYLSRLEKTFRRFSGSHFVVATHSPLIVSGMGPTHSNVISLESGHVDRSGEELSGKSADEVLISAFDVAGSNNLYLKQSVVQALRMAADGAIYTPQFSDLMASLNRAVELSGVNEAVREVVSDLDVTVKKARLKNL